MSTTTRLTMVIAASLALAACSPSAGTSPIDASPAATAGSAVASVTPEPTVREAAWTADTGTEMWATPAAFGDLVVVGGNDGVVRAFALADGAPRWEFETAGDVRAQAAIDGDSAYVLSDDGNVYALDPTGALLWAARAGEPASDREPYDVFGSRPAVADGVVYAGTETGTVTAFDAATGDVRWVADVEAPVESNLALGNGLVHVSTMAGVHYALAMADGSEVWSVSHGKSFTTSPLVMDGNLYIGSRATKLVKLDEQTGEKEWSVGFGSSWVQSGAQPLAEDQIVIGSSDLRTVRALDVNTGGPVWSTETTGWPWGIPAVADGVVYETQHMVDYQQPWEIGLYALDAKDGHVIWTASAGPALEYQPDGYSFYGNGASAIVADQYVITAGLDGVVRAYTR